MINVPIITNDDIESFAVGLELIDISLNILLDPAESEVQVLISKFDGLSLIITYIRRERSRFMGTEKVLYLKPIPLIEPTLIFLV